MSSNCAISWSRCLRAYQWNGIIRCREDVTSRNLSSALGLNVPLGNGTRPNLGFEGDIVRDESHISFIIFRPILARLQKHRFDVGLANNVRPTRDTLRVAAQLMLLAPTYATTSRGTRTRVVFGFVCEFRPWVRLTSQYPWRDIRWHVRQWL
jgi:hypothetical protein